jgi:hypothetical protein
MIDAVPTTHPLDPGIASVRKEFVQAIELRDEGRPTRRSRRCSA